MYWMLRPIHTLLQVTEMFTAMLSVPRAVYLMK